MNVSNRFLLHVILMPSLAVTFSTTAFADASLEEQADSIAKKYGSGNSIGILCGPKGSRKCTISTRISRKKHQIHLDFDDYGIRPDMQQLSLYVQSLDGNEYSFKVGVLCQDEDMALVPEIIGIAECVADFKVVDGRIEGQPSVQIFPITTQMLSRPIKAP